MTRDGDHRVTPVEIREEYAQLIIDDLYGPAGGPDEQLDVTQQDRYLVGMLAPRRLVAGAPPNPIGSSSPDDADAWVAEETENADTADSDDGGLPDATAKPMLFPSSKGISFAVPAATEAVRVTASWGRYTREETTGAGSDPGGEAEAESQRASRVSGAEAGRWTTGPQAVRLQPPALGAEVAGSDPTANPPSSGSFARPAVRSRFRCPPTACASRQ